MSAAAGPTGPGIKGRLNHNPRMLLRWITFFVWAAVAASALFWGLRLMAKAPPAPAQVQVADASAVVRGDLTRLLGADAPAAVIAAVAEPAADARFNLVGVVSPRSAQAAREAVALIAVDGKPARAYRVGTVVEGQNVLQSVNARGAILGPRDGPALVALKIAPPAAATTGALPAATSQFAVPPNAVPPNAVPPRFPMAVPQAVPHQYLPPPQQQPQPPPFNPRDVNAPKF